MVKKPFKDLTIYLGIMEEYRNCFENYEISNFGNLRRKLYNGEYKTINGSIQNKGYRYFQLVREGKRVNYLFHHLVAKVFIGERPEKFDIDHIDRNKLNNNLTNLRYVTHRDNTCNIDRFIDDIPKDEEDRRFKVQKLYVEKNRDKILLKKKEYYSKNKEKYSEYFKLKYNEKKDIFKCSICSEEKLLSIIAIKQNKSRICQKCNSREQLKKINNINI